jgi:uncharacterized cupredoxin-like copper-binding protein
MLSTTRWSIVLGTLLIGAAGVLVSCGDDDGTPTATAATNATSEASAARVDVTVKDYSITTTPTSIKAGEVRFFVKNTGAVEHELVVVQSDADPAALPVYSATDKRAEGHVVGDVDEDKVTSEGEVEGIEAGATKDATFDLKPGKYVLMCNLATHYTMGMRVAFTVE